MRPSRFACQILLTMGLTTSSLGCGAGQSAAPFLPSQRSLSADSNGALLGRVYQDSTAAAKSIVESKVEQGPATQADGDGAAAQRKIIYTAQISLIVQDFAKVETEVNQVVEQFGGYVAGSQVDSTQSVQRSGRWVLRIPVDRFDSFIDSVVQLGVPESRQTNAQDVTEEFVDLEARLANKQQIEQRILKLLDERSGDIKDVIAVETELGRVREEIERMEGRHRYLTNQTAMTTVTVDAREERNYVPPQAPTFAGLVGKTWGNSWTALGSAAKAVALATIATVPWLIVLAPVVTILWWTWRRRRLAPARS
jgi:hypothetical protein